MPFERPLHGRPQDIVALFVGYPAAGEDPDYVIRQFLDDLYHRTARLLWSRKVARPADAKAGGSSRRASRLEQDLEAADHPVHVTLQVAQDDAVAPHILDAD